MNTLLAVIIGALTVYLAYTLYARRIDRYVIQSDPKRATPAKLFMDGVDFMPTNRNILFGYHFKSIAAAGPIIGAIVAATLWGWLPSIIWLVLGVSFIGWASDYSAIVLSVRNEGNSLSAVAHRLISPRTRTILFLSISHDVPKGDVVWAAGRSILLNFVIVTVLGELYTHFRSLSGVKAIFYGVSPAFRRVLS